MSEVRILYQSLCCKSANVAPVGNMEQHAETSRAYVQNTLASELERRTNSIRWIRGTTPKIRFIAEYLYNLSSRPDLVVLGEFLVDDNLREQTFMVWDSVAASPREYKLTSTLCASAKRPNCSHARQLMREAEIRIA